MNSMKIKPTKTLRTILIVVVKIPNKTPENLIHLSKY